MIHARDLTKTYGTVTAVDSVSFRVPEGRITGFLGPNGSGKTTTLRMLLGLVTPTSGSITVGGRPYTALARPLTSVGAALDGQAFAAGRTGRQHLRCWADLADADGNRVERLLQEVGLADAADRRVGGYSLGMRQRLSLATALLGDPATLVLDEPANGLDPDGILWLRTFLLGLAAEGRTVLVASHMLAEAQRMVDDVLLIRSGRLVYSGTKDDLLSQGPAHHGGDLEDAYMSLTRKAA